MGIIISIIIGCVCGFLAGKIMKGGGFGILINLLLGIVGGAVGSWLFSLFGIDWGGIIDEIGTGTIGAILVLWIASLFK